MKKKLWLFIVLFPLLLMSCSGGSYVIKTGGLTSTANSISGEYSQFSGNYYKEVVFDEGEEVSFSYLTSSKNGTLSAKLLDSSGEVIKDITDNLKITIPKKDTYKIQVEAENHKGSFIISWDEENKD